MSKRYPETEMAHLADEHVSHWECDHCANSVFVIVEPMDYESGVKLCWECTRKLSVLLSKLAVSQ